MFTDDSGPRIVPDVLPRMPCENLPMPLLPAGLESFIISDDIPVREKKGDDVPRVRAR